MPIVPPSTPSGLSQPPQANPPSPETLLMAAAQLHSQGQLVQSADNAKRPGKIKVKAKP